MNYPLHFVLKTYKNVRNVHYSAIFFVYVKKKLYLCSAKCIQTRE